jgi:hypothetical protein
MEYARAEHRSAEEDDLLDMVDKKSWQAAGCNP